MADTLVERLTGQTCATAVPLDVRITDHPDHPPDDDGGTPTGGDDPGTPRDEDPSSEPPPGTAEPAGLVLPDAALKRLRGQAGEPAGVRLLVPWVTLQDGDRPGVLIGQGPIPAPLVRELIVSAAGGLRFSVSPRHTGRASPSRTFRGRLKQSIEERDQRCRDPFCGSPIRHFDHIRRWSEGGPTSYANGRGVCERGNYIRELPRWTVRLLDPVTHTIETTTPTGHTYTSQPPRPP